MQRVPNLFLIGAMKGGSTSLFDALVRHPGIARLRRKEPSIFSQVGDAAVRARLAEFPAPQGDALWLIDGSVEYSRWPLYPTTPETILRFCGRDVRFVYILRHPVDRLVSEYFWMQERYGQPLDIARVVEADPQYVQTSLYDVQIERYLEHFDRDRMRFVLFDDFARDRDATVAGVLEWLGLDPALVESAGRHRGATDKRTTRAPRFMGLSGLLWASPRLRRAVRERLPERTVRHLARFMTVEAPRVEPPQSFRDELMWRHFAASIVRTERLTGLDLSCWSEGASPPRPSLPHEREEAAAQA